MPVLSYFFIFYVMTVDSVFFKTTNLVCLCLWVRWHECVLLKRNISISLKYIKMVKCLSRIVSTWHALALLTLGLLHAEYKASSTVPHSAEPLALSASSISIQLLMTLEKAHLGTAVWDSWILHTPCKGLDQSLYHLLKSLQQSFSPLQQVIKNIRSKSHRV